MMYTTTTALKKTRLQRALGIALFGGIALGASGMLSANWQEHLTISGYVAIDAVYEKMEEENYSDLIISGAGLHFAAEIAENVTADIAFYYEDGYDHPDLDEATISFNPGGGPLTFVAGRTYLPFGDFSSNMVSDPITLAMGEIREDALLLNMEMEGLYSSVYLFNGDIEKYDANDTLSNYGLRLGYYWDQGDTALDIGVDWINSIYDTDGIEWALNELYGTNTVFKRISGLGAHIHGRYGPFSLYTGYVGATDDLAGKGTNTQARAWNLEAGYDFLIGDMDATVALGYQESTEAAMLELPEKRISGAVSMEVANHTTLAFEYRRDTGYDREKSHAGIAQVAVEF